MATPAELAFERTNLDEDQLAPLQRLLGTWGILADLSFSDLVLMAPMAPDPTDPRPAGGPAGRTGGTAGPPGLSRARTAGGSLRAGAPRQAGRLGGRRRREQAKCCVCVCGGWGLGQARALAPMRRPTRVNRSGG